MCDKPELIRTSPDGVEVPATTIIQWSKVPLKLLTAAACAESLTESLGMKVSVGQLKTWTAAGMIPYIEVGNAKGYLPSAVHDVLISAAACTSRPDVIPALSKTREDYNTARAEGMKPEVRTEDKEPADEA